MSFQPGDKVVRVSLFEPNGNYSYPDEIPIKGRIYLVTWVGEYQFMEGLFLSIRVAGIRRIHYKTLVDVPTAIVSKNGVVRYRKLDDLKSESRERFYRDHPKTVENSGCHWI